MLKTNDNYDLGNEFVFYKDKYGYKIDLVVLDESNILHPIEIKSRTKVDTSMISSFKKLNGLTNVGSGGVLCMSKELLDLNDNNKVIPIGSIIG